MNKYLDIPNTIIEEAIGWHRRFNSPPTYAFVMPQTLKALMFEAFLNSDRSRSVGYQELTISCKVGDIRVLSDNTIDQPHITYVSNDPDAKYIDYIAEKILLGDDNG